MIQKTQDFETGLSEWFDCPTVDYTWQIFKSHFTSTHTALKRIIGPILRNTAHHQANQMVAELSTNFERMRDEVLTRVHALV